MDNTRDPRIITLPPKRLIGMRVRMTMAEPRTTELWRGFMPRRKEIAPAVGTDLFSLQVYAPHFQLQHFTPQTTFDRWAAVEVPEHATVPAGMEELALTGGQYAVFLHQGPASAGPRTFGFIYGVWAPAAPYRIDNTRPHFEVLGPKYKHEDPSSEEDVFIPIAPKD